MGMGFASLMFDRSICTGNDDDIDDALESMPSGHATAAFAGLIFLALYFNAQLKVMSAHNPAYWKMIMFFAPILGAVLIAGSLTIDKCELALFCCACQNLTDVWNRSSLVRHSRGCSYWDGHGLCRLSADVCLRLGLPIQPRLASSRHVPPPSVSLPARRPRVAVLHVRTCHWGLYHA